MKIIVDGHKTVQKNFEGGRDVSRDPMELKGTHQVRFELMERKGSAKAVLMFKRLPACGENQY